MSGIAGVVDLIGRADIPATIEQRLLDAILLRGPDGTETWREGAITFAHSHRETTGYVGRCLGRAGETSVSIVADMRLDARPELIAALQLDATRTWSDVDLVREAYLRWDLDFPNHLSGDFSLALWDHGRERLVCVRDHMGIKPLFYAQRDGRLLFCSELIGVTTPDNELNDRRIVGFLAAIYDEPQQTAFAGAYRLLPAHILVVEGGEVVVSRYWELSGSTLTTTPDAAAQLRQMLGQAVADRLTGSVQMGAMLSGGLDSSSIVATAIAPLAKSHRQLHTFSFDYPQTPALNEGDYAKAVIDSAPQHLTPTFVSFDDYQPLTGLERILDGRTDLLFGPGMPKVAALLNIAAASRTQVVLDGHGGDEVVSHGFERLGELARAARWRKLYREVSGAAAVFGDDANKVFFRYFLVFGPFRRIARALHRRRPDQAGADTADPMTGLLNRDIAIDTASAERQQSWDAEVRAKQRDHQAAHLWNLSNPLVGCAFEALDRVATVANVELRFPFFDRRLVNFAVALPAEEALQDGWTRSVLRRAMDGLLPPSVRWRRTKVDFAGEVRLGMARYHRPLLEHLTDPAAGLGRYLDLPKLGLLVQRYLDAPASISSGELFALWRCVALHLWLRGRSAQQ